MTTTIASFVAFLLLFTGIGALSVRRSRHSVDDYLLAGRSTGPVLIGLASVVTNNSGYMFIGLIGFTYAFGLPAIWLTVGWITGDLIAWFTVHPALRRRSQDVVTETVPGFMATENGRMDRALAVALSAVTVVFLGTYAAAQLNAGSKALFVLLHWNYAAGAVIGAVIVTLYCFAGGIRASIWTNAAQSFVMIAAMFALLAFAMADVGGPASLLRELRRIDPALTRPFPEGLAFGFVPYLLGWIAAGLGVSGQPHILICTMALRSASVIRTARRVYFLWYVPFSAAAVGVALYARVLLPDIATFDPELALPRMAQLFMPGVLVGLVLAGLFAATISTADSQILACSAAFSQDILPNVGQSYWKTKLATLAVTAFVLTVALTASANVFSLVIIAWSGLAAGLGPLMMVRLLGRPIDTATGLLMIAGGLGAVLLWRFGLRYTMDVYEILPGMATGLALYPVGRLAARLRARSGGGAPAVTGREPHHAEEG